MGLKKKHSDDFSDYDSVAVRIRGSVDLSSPSRAPSSPSKHRRAAEKRWKMGLAVFATICWGLSSVFIKHILATLDPVPYLVMCLFGSAASLWLAIAVTRPQCPSVEVMLRVSYIGVLYPGVSSLTTDIGLTFCSVSAETLIWSTESLMVIGLAQYILGERAPSQVVGLAVCSLVGVLLLTSAEHDTEGFEGVVGDEWIPRHLSRYFGYFLVLIATCSSALYNVLSKQTLNERIDPLVLVACHQTMGFVFSAFAFVLWFSSSTGPPLMYETWDVVLSVFSGVWSSALPLWLFFTMLDDVDASVGIVVTSLIPVWGIMGAMVFLGETMVGVQWLGIVIVLASTYAISHFDH